jgi:thymidylate kinase
MNKYMLSRDFFFEFSGMPKSGKTTVCDVVVHFLKRQGFRIQEYHGGGRYAPIDKSALTSLDMHLACKAMDFLLISSEREKTQMKIHIMDRGIYDKSIFTRTLLKMGKIDLDSAEATINFLTIPCITRLIDGVFLFITTPELSLSREYKNKLIEKTGRIMNTSVLEALRMVILEESQKENALFPNLYLIDTEKFDGKIEECAQTIIDKIIAKVN